MRMFLLGFVITSLFQAPARGAEPAHELSGGLGLATDLAPRTPGGVKYFGSYAHRLGQAWLDLQLNYTRGGPASCVPNGSCDDWHRFEGRALELVLGTKLRRQLHAALQGHLRCGLAGELIWLGDLAGFAAGLRVGSGLRYLVHSRVAVSAELSTAFGPSLVHRRAGLEAFVALDLALALELAF